MIGFQFLWKQQYDSWCQTCVERKANEEQGELQLFINCAASGSTLECVSHNVTDKIPCDLLFDAVSRGWDVLWVRTLGGKGWTSKSVGAQLKGEGGSERVIPVTGKLTSWYSVDSGPARCSYCCITKQSQARCGAGQTLSHWVTLGAQVWHTWPYKVIQPLQI